MFNDNKIITRGYGKVIISGEHAVVYGTSAIAFAINLYTEAECIINNNDNINTYINIIEITYKNLNEKIYFKLNDILLIFNDKFNESKDNKSLKYHFLFCLYNLYKKVKEKLNNNQQKANKIIDYFNNHQFIINITSNISIGYCIGSSAAYNVAICKNLCILFENLLNITFNDKDILLLSNLFESIFHNNTPSGIDVTCSLYGGLILFKNIEQKKHLNIPKFFINELNIFLIDSGNRKETGKLIKNVSNLKEKNKEVFEGILKEIGDVSKKIEELLTNSNFNLSTLSIFYEYIKKNQNLLLKLGVSTTKINEIIELLGKRGYIGKITGSGGGGYLLFFVVNEKIDEFQNILKENNIKYIKVDIKEKIKDFDDI